MANTVELTSSQESIITDAGAFLSPALQRLLRQRVLDELRDVPEVGDGILWRTVARAQKSIWDPPADSVDHHRPRLFRKLG